MFLQFCCVVGRHNLIILWGDRAIYPEKGLLATTYKEKAFLFLSSFRNKKATYLKNHELSLQFPWLSVCCMYVQRGRHVIGPI